MRWSWRECLVMMVAMRAGVARFMFDILCHSWILQSWSVLGCRINCSRHWLGEIQATSSYRGLLGNILHNFWVNEGNIGVGHLITLISQCDMFMYSYCQIWTEREMTTAKYWGDTLGQIYWELACCCQVWSLCDGSTCLSGSWLMHLSQVSYVSGEVLVVVVVVVVTYSHHLNITLLPLHGIHLDPQLQLEWQGSRQIKLMLWLDVNVSYCEL